MHQPNLLHILQRSCVGKLATLDGGMGGLCLGPTMMAEQKQLAMTISFPAPRPITRGTLTSLP
jgi:hypothetical protein